MRGNEMLEQMELVDPAYVEAADAAPKKKKKKVVIVVNGSIVKEPKCDKCNYCECETCPTWHGLEQEDENASSTD